MPQFLIASIITVLMSCANRQLTQTVNNERKIVETIELNDDGEALNFDFETDEFVVYFNSDEVLSYFQTKNSTESPNLAIGESDVFLNGGNGTYEKMTAYLLTNQKRSFKSVSNIDSLNWKNKSYNEIRAIRQENEEIDFLILFEPEICTLIDTLSVAIQHRGLFLNKIFKYLNEETYFNSGQSYYTYETKDELEILKCRTFFRYN